MNSVFDQGPPAPCPTPFNMAAHVLARGALTPDKIALSVLGGDNLTYGALRAAVLGTATGLLQAGAVVGDRVLMRLGNTVDFPLAYLGALAAGLVPVPTASALTAREVEWLMQKEFARVAEDVVWRRTKLGLRLSPEQIATLDAWMKAQGVKRQISAAE